MEKDKSRGVKHLRDKQKYKPKARASATNIAHNNVELKKVTKNLESNWDRYEKPELESEGSLTSRGPSTDYSIIAHGPISQGSYFQLKSNPEFDSKKTSDNPLFNLDLNLLALSISTVPFHKRCNFDGYFSNEEQFEMNQKANSCKEQYLALVNKEDAPIEQIASEFDERKNSVHKIIEDVENLEISGDVEKNEDKEAKGEEDLEQWLDDILDT